MIATYASWCIRANVEVDFTCSDGQSLVQIGRRQVAWWQRRPRLVDQSLVLTHDSLAGRDVVGLKILVDHVDAVACEDCPILGIEQILFEIEQRQARQERQVLWQIGQLVASASRPHFPMSKRERRTVRATNHSHIPKRQFLQLGHDHDSTIDLGNLVIR